MNGFFRFMAVSLAVSALFVSCAKKPLTLDDETSMKALLNASDAEITELVVKEAKEKANLSDEEIKVEYILRDKESQSIAVKVRTSRQDK